MTNENNRLGLPWKAEGGFLDSHVGECVADFWEWSDLPDAAEDDALALTVAAVNACHAVNPSDPLAVAQYLPQLVRHVAGMVGNGERHYPTQSEHGRLVELLAAILPKGEK